MKSSCAFIVIDSGFSQEVLSRSRKVLACWDLSQDRPIESASYLSSRELSGFAGDSMNHGSIVLSRLLDRVPDAPLVLVRAFNTNRGIFRTTWQNGQVARAGWSEAYVWAVELCRKRNLSSVANCSFGGFDHAMDGSGWEAHQLNRVTGSGRAGHVMVSAAGPGDGRAQHSTMLLLSGDEKNFVATQDGVGEYNMWFGLGQPLDDAHSASCNWWVEVLLNGETQFTVGSEQVPENFWNSRRQLKFTVHGAGRVDIRVKRDSAHQCANELCAFRVDCWTEDGWFHNYVNPLLISEPACFPNVIAVGLRTLQYNAFQKQAGEKPEVLLSGTEQISFRTPEVTAAVGKLLTRDPSLDVDQVRSLLGKYPDPDSLIEN